MPGILKIRDPNTGEYVAIPAIQGEKGDTPVRGTDYWTAEDQAQIVSDVLAALGEMGYTSD